MNAGTAEMLEGRLRQANRLAMAATLLRGMAMMVTVLAAATLLAIGIDAAIGLPGWGLVALDVLLVLLAIVLLISVARLAYGWRYRPRRAAVLLEQRMGWTDNRLINALWLAEHDGGRDSPVLREQAVQQGVRAAADVPGTALVDRKPMRRSIGLAVAAVVVSGLMYLAMPGVFHAVLPRLLDPQGDHPPFTLLRFDIAADPMPVYYGQPATIRADLAGPRLPAQASVVFVDASGQRHRLPMYRTQASDAATASSQADEGARFQLQIDQVNRSRRFYIDTPEGRSRLQTLEMRPVPLLERVQVAYDYPSYTGWQAARERLSPGGIRGLAGTRVRLTFDSNVPLAGGELTLTPGEEAAGEGVAPQTVALSPDADEPTRAHAVFDLEHDGRFAVLLHGTDGTTSHETLRGSMRATPDDRPRVRIDEPERQAMVPEGWTVPVRISANDDIAVDRLAISRGVNRWSAIPTSLQAERRDRDGRQVTAMYQFDLEALGARAGDTIHFYATAYDGHPGEQSTDSAVHVFQVVSEEEWAEFARQRYRIEDMEREWREMQRQLHDLEARREAALEQMAALREQIDAGETLTEDQREQMAQLADELSDYSNEMLDLFEEIRDRTQQPTLYAFERPYMDMLRRMHMEVQAQATAAAQAGRAMRRAGSDASPANMDQLAQAMQQFAEQDRPFTAEDQRERDEADRDLARIRQAEQLLAQTQQLQQIVERQREVEQRLSAYRHRESLSPAEQLRAARLGEEQAELRRQTQQARDRLSELGEEAAESLPLMSASALDLADALDALQVQRDQQDAEQLAHAGHGRYAHQAADAAAEKLESLVGQCEGMAGNAMADLDRPLGLSESQMQQSLQQMASARAMSIGATGSNGSGMQGSRSRMALAGPTIARGGDSDAAAQNVGGDGDGDADDADNADRAGAADRVTVEQTTERGGGGANLPGVPARYRRDAEAYFQRLADDSQ